MRQLRVATLHSKNDYSFLARCHTPLAWLGKQSAIEVVPPLKAWTADVVVLHDQWQPGALAVVQSLQRHGIRVVANLDEMPDTAGGQRLLEAVDLVLAPT